MLHARTLALTGALLLPAAPAQVTWTQRTPAHAPSARSAHAMAYDAARKQVVLFGGATLDPANPTAAGDTWTFDGHDWTEHQNLSPTPAPRWYHAMAYDEARQRVVLFGGWDGATTNLADTWEWDGTRWQQVSSSGPPPLRAQVMTYDAARQRVVLFGGALGPYSTPTASGDVWEWTGQTWIKASAAGGPAPRWSSALAYDAASGRVLMMGGTAVGNVFFDDTWTWDGQTWTRQSPAVGAPFLGYQSAVYHASRGRIVMFGGTDASYQPRAETREWDGLDWELRVPATVATARYNGALVYDRDRDRVIAFGGYGGQLALADTWEYTAAPSASFTPFGSGCAGSAGTPHLAAAYGRLPWLASTFTVELTALPSGLLNVPVMMLGGSRTIWNGTPLPLDLTSLGMTGCSLRVSPSVTFTLANRSGRATWSLVVPNNPALLGASIYLQGLVVDPAANPLGITATNAGQATIGGR